MIADASTAGLPDELTADIVIIGSGAAGIVLALELAKTALDVIVVEAGGQSFSREGQAFYRAESVAPSTHGPVDMFRRRVFGGSTSVWGGRCIPFDPIDFEDRPWMGGASWPIAYDEVARHYPAALRYAEAGAPEFDAEHALPGEPAALVPGVSSPDVVLDRLERFSHPTDFGKWHRDALEKAPRVRLFTNAPVEQILASDEGARVAGVRVRLAEGRAVRMLAPRVVVAAGGIETARLLLNSNEARGCGLGNERDLVGRYYQCHLEGELGHVSFTPAWRDLRLDYQRSHDGIYVRRYMWLSPEAQRARQLAGLVLRPAHANIVDPAHRNAILSAMYLAKNFIVPEYARKMTSLELAAREAAGGSNARLLAGHMRNVLLSSPRLAAFSADWTRRRVLARRKLPSVFLRDPRGRYPVDVNAEQEPNFDSRILLGDERDALGLRRVRIDWHTRARDIDRVIEGVRVIGTALAESGAARIDVSPEDIERWRSQPIPVGGHHVGTARISNDPSTGVCDENAEIFGTRGLFVAGAAAFSTSGFANPTLTLMALTLRLSEFLSKS